MLTNKIFNASALHLAKAGNSKEAERIRKIYEEMKAEQ